MKKVIKYLIIVCIIILISILVVVSVQEKNTEEDVIEYKQEKPTERYTKTKEKYECNEFEFVSVNTEQLVRIYFNKFKNAILNDTQKGYELLDEEYRKKRFGSLEEFEVYVEQNKEIIGSVSLTKYKTTNYSDYVQYICIDSRNNYYVFNAESIMNFSVYLDTYTIDIPQYIKEYEESNTQEKVALNIDKIIKALNNKDYNYVYNHLSETFKQSNYNTKDDFINYIQNICYENMEVKYGEFTNEGDIYIYNIELIDSTGVNINNIDMQIIMKLEEREFVLSFNF